MLFSTMTLATNADLHAAATLARRLRPLASTPAESAAVECIFDLAAFADVGDVGAAELSKALDAVADLVARSAGAVDVLADSRVVRVSSQRIAGLSYSVTMVGARAAACTCPDFVRSSKVLGLAVRCKHMASAEQTGGAAGGAAPCIVAPRRRSTRKAA